ncbi:ABC transporter ATP-binding protein [Actinokineospora iranica]|uniref:Putative ABC transport system ATP-binding protein n=1 Tax=Actinokineospora iranica TaxID=1271860 RepID=A0A1G6TA33_9PSEU|nr:ATP-binding cassette domain-containing protein [Actinokineospora iranica]SDD25992.1 putative ABC transport system ATP-binding protein [Actinokineospora iranica]
MSAALLTLTGIAKSYHDGAPVHALLPTDLRVDEGDYVSVTGPSGAGKSTLLNVLGLLDLPTEGSYEVAGVETVRAAESLRVAIRGQWFGFVFQSFALLAGRTAVENVELGMLYRAIPARRRRALAMAALDRVRLAHRAHADPRTLSGGERQRVAIARAIAASPRVLFCDEPTGNLDSGNTDNILDLIGDLHADGQTVVVVTHDSKVARRGVRHVHVADGIVREAPAAQRHQRGR